MDTSRKTAGLFALSRCRVNAAIQVVSGMLELPTK